MYEDSWIIQRNFVGPIDVSRGIVGVWINVVLYSA